VVTLGMASAQLNGQAPQRRLCPHCGHSFLEPVRGRIHAACIELSCPHCGTAVWAFSSPVALGREGPAAADWAGAVLGDGA
jgi:hydrogenase maturation factor HypF (carbamoyltransferase family)